MNAFKCACEAANEAGKVLKKYWGKDHQIAKKQGDSDLVTEADGEAEKVVIEIIKKYYPEHGILAEESGAFESDSEYLWVIDPLDGTTNYAHNLPFSAVSIALLKNGDPILGVVYNPLLEEFFSAQKGQGAYLNNKAISVSKIDQLKNSVFVTGFPYDRTENRHNNYLEFCYFTHLTQGVRRFGAAAIDLCYVAMGRFDGFWEQKLSIWDIAAGVLILEEAGGKVSDYKLEKSYLKSGEIIATNSLLHQITYEKLNYINQKESANIADLF